MFGFFNRTKIQKPKKPKPFRMSDVRKTYDEIPQPKGEFRDLFQEMRECSAAKRRQASDNNVCTCKCHT